MEGYNPFKERAEFAKGHKILNAWDLRRPESAKEKPPELKASIVVAENIEAFVYSEAAVNNLIAAVERGYVMAELKEDGGLDILLMEIQQLPNELGHVAEPANFHRNIDNPVWGTIEADQFTYLQTTDFGVEGYFGGDAWASITGEPAQLIRVYIDAEKLKKMRGVYLDPESLNVTEEEFGHSFVVIGGIPRATIIRAEAVEIPVRPRENFIPKEGIDWVGSSQESTEQDLENRKKRLIEFLRDKTI